MLIAHLPAGYIFGRTIHAKESVLGLVLLAAVLPDIDMLWFHFVDHKAVHHHRYWMHAPGFWAGIYLLTVALIAKFKRQWLWPATLCFMAILLHLVLDTLVGDIMWLWPFSTEFFRLATVPATQSHWILSFIFHWSFMVELLVCFVALVLFLRKRQT